ncbi:MAG: ECF transporter S component [Prevotellaceae bacterium]|nr:ECF transporter S component [Prevotellaceae bacterium]
MEKVYSLNLTQIKAYVFAALFVAGNLVLPFAIHHLPAIGGYSQGLMWLPIYFFTLVAAYKFGWQVGLLTAVLSPVINCLLFGIPMSAMLPAILVKSVLLAVAAAFFAQKAGKVALWAILASILAYQFIGTGIEFFINDMNFNAAIVDFRFGFPGMLLQLFGGYLVLKAMRTI